MSELDKKALEAAAKAIEDFCCYDTSTTLAEDCIRAYLDASPAPTVSGEPVARQHRFRTGLNMDGPWGGWRNGRAAMHEVQSYYQERPLFAHPAPTRDDVLEEAATKADRIAEIIKRNLYHQHEKVEDARMFALQLAGDLRSLKGGKS